MSETFKVLYNDKEISILKQPDPNDKSKIKIEVPKYDLTRQMPLNDEWEGFKQISIDSLNMYSPITPDTPHNTFSQITELRASPEISNSSYAYYKFGSFRQIRGHMNN